MTDSCAEKGKQQGEPGTTSHLENQFHGNNEVIPNNCFPILEQYGIWCLTDGNSRALAILHNSWAFRFELRLPRPGLADGTKHHPPDHR
jgi:hypothetical protein